MPHFYKHHRSCCLGSHWLYDQRGFGRVLSLGGAFMWPAQKAVCSLLRLISVFPVQTQAEAHSPRCWFREAADLGTSVRALGQPLSFPDVERLRLNLPGQKAARSSTFPSLFFLPLSLFKTIPGSLHHLTDFPN